MVRSTHFLFLSLLLFSLSSFAAVTSRDCQNVWSEILSQGELPSVYSPLKNLCGDEFRRKLRDVISTNRDLGYSGARKAFFSDVDNVNGVVCGVYTGRCIRTNGIPNPSDMNCEHSWPQSKGASGIAKSDINHLFPADSSMNSRRSNYPFCEVADPSYEAMGSALGNSKYGTKCFEPPFAHKGDLARAMMYFSVRYNKPIDQEQEEFFRKWYEEDPVSEKEMNRNDSVERIQGNRNPFIDVPQFVYLIDNF